MVMVRVPVVALLDVVIFIVEVPAPVMQVGLKEMELAVTWPDADKVMAELEAAGNVVVMVAVPENAASDGERSWARGDCEAGGVGNGERNVGGGIVLPRCR